MDASSLMEQILSRGDLNVAYLQVVRHRVEIPKPDGGTKNPGVPTVTDRSVQQAIVQVLTPVYGEQFHDHSYGFRPNRCAQQATITALDRTNDGYDWTADTDLEKFSDTVNHGELMTLMGRTIKDGEVVLITRKFPAGGVKEDDEYGESVIRTRQGGDLSPLLANIMWNESDKGVGQRGLSSVRYADDCINMVGSEMSAKRAVRSIT